MIARVICCSVILFTAASCHRVTYRLNTDVQDRTYKEAKWNHFFLWGLAPVTESWDLETLCPGSKLVEVKTYNSPANVLSSAVSLGSSTGRTLEYVCTYPEGLLEKSAGKLSDKFLSNFGLQERDLATR